MTGRDAATQAQARAADPAGSVWLSANAGSGKTRVLTDRVARLLLDGVSPQNVLCLTYTKAAASEMQNRLFARLGSWAMAEEAALRQSLADLGLTGRISDARIAGARRLFARAIETPGGLKIQTIHSFCAALLRRFPLEAGVSPQFREMDDRSATALRNAALDRIAAGPDAGVLDRLAAYLSGDDLSDLMTAIAGARDMFGPVPDRDAIWAALGLPADMSEERILRDLGLEGDRAAFSALLSALRGGSANDTKAAEKLQAVDPSCLRLTDLPVLENVFLTGPKAKAGAYTAKIDAFPTKATRNTLGPQMDAINALMGRVEQARHHRCGLYTAGKTLALHEFAAVFLREYDHGKNAHGWLDFDDLILKARALLTRPEVAQWVLFRLDGDIDHILVDEAQDTSPEQWQVIEQLTREFAAGQGARADTHRTIFVVGDRKQSIFSFQGADPQEFDRMRAEFAGRLKVARRPFETMKLEHSFRSAAPVLRLVDAVFGGGDGDDGSDGTGWQDRHIAFRTTMPGRVDLWPAEPKAETTDPGEWYAPVDRVAENHHMVILASRIADRIKSMVGQATIPDADRAGGYRMRPVREGDFLILVQRRSLLFQELIRACKNRGLQTSGADRLKIGAELAVRDITALLSFLATPEDDLSLAVALRSPLFGWSERDLHALAAPRPKGSVLWAALRGQADRHPETLAMLGALRDDTDFLRPHDLIERILIRHNGRRRLLARLGPEAEDGIDALLHQALAYERSDIPGLTGFLAWLDSDEAEVKRRPETAGNRIRVMTVHGAKGLESPIVILPDTAAHTSRIRDGILPGADGPALWAPPADMRSAPVAAAHERLVTRQAAERDRLLYVAMTRAEKWLIVTGAGDMGKEDGRAWYQRVVAGMKRAGAVPYELAEGTGLRLSGGDWPETAGTTPPPAPVCAETPMTAEGIPDWAHHPPPPPPDTPAPLAPSALGGAKVLPGPGGAMADDAPRDDGPEQEAAMLRGARIHLLLEHLPAHPRDHWPELSRTLLRARFPDDPDADLQDALAEAAGVITAPGLGFLFAPDALAEVDLSATVPELSGHRVSGVIDRLIITPGKVLAVDFKTNAAIPARPEDTPDGILRQLGAYAAALGQIYPDREIATAILWTASATLMTIPRGIVKQALEQAALS